MKIKFKVNSKTIHVFGQTYELREQLKAAGGRWDKLQKAWSFSYDPDTVELLNTWLDLKIPPPAVIPEIKPENNNHKNNFLLPLYSHQKKSVILGRNAAIMADLSDPGTGKTRVQIELMLERNIWPVLVICPKSIMEPVWKRQLEEAGIKPHLLNSGSENLKKYLRSWLKSQKRDRQVFVINYEMVPRVLSEISKINWKYIICDESTRIKSRNAKRSRAVMKLRDIPKYRSILTGTPAPNGLLDIFNQFRWLDPRLFGENYYVFRQRYFHQKPWDQWNWYPNNDAVNRVKKRIAPISVQWRKRDCLDLPPLVEEERHVEMNLFQRKLYNQMKEQLLIELDNTEIAAPFLMTKLMKLRQIASGFAYDHAGTGHEISNRKVNELIDLLGEINGQVIIFTHFRFSENQVAQAISEPVAMFTSSQSTKEREKNLEEFENGHKRILVANTISAAHGLNLQFCSNIIYYELDFSLETFEQSRQRIERIGQKNKMTVYYLLTKNTIEPWILKKLKDKIDINKQIDINELQKAL